MTIRAAVATEKTDAELRQRYRKLGRIARKNDVKREDCPVDGLIKHWWLEGWDGVYPYHIVAQ